VYPFWESVVHPLLLASGASRVVEIGALRGDTTVRLVRDLGEGSQLHVIDPLPDFDPGVHERAFPGQYIFHRALSLEVLDEIPPMDAALIDGDHNWYTVINELRSLARVARDGGKGLPLMILHDVGWPYARRDLYYDPSNIPPEHRQPYEQAGINRRTDELKKDGGFNRTLHHAIAPDGPRNGVMTAVDDFLDEYDEEVRLVVLPIYYGLAIIASSELLEARPALRALLDRLESSEGRGELLELSEEIRLDAANTEQAFNAEYLRRIDSLADRWLTVVKKAASGELAPEQEMRIDHLRQAEDSGDDAYLHDPVRADRPGAEALAARHRNGGDSGHGPLTTIGRTGVDLLHRWLDETSAIPGDLVDCGTGRGGLALVMRAHLEATFRPKPTVWVLDRFRSDSPGDLNTVRDTLDHFDLLDDRVRFLTGAAHESVPGSPISSIALLSIDQVDTEDLHATLAVLYPLLSDGGRAIVATHGDSAREDEVARFVEAIGAEAAAPTSRITTWVKSAENSEPPPAPAPSVPAATAPLLEGGIATKDLTMVVVFYDMVREAPRTLRALSRSYQEGIEDLDYEVLVIENGSPEGRRLDRSMVESFGPEFVFVDLAGQSTPSPTTALNQGIARAQGEVVGLMIDGAHLLTPGVIREAMVGMRAYAPAVVATQIWHLGPGQQSETMTRGYDQAAEDRLLEVIEWPTDGYRLFDMAHFQADRDWLSGMWESNCLFVSRDTLRQVGGFDDSFDEAGGGYANLEIFERVCTAPDVTMVTLIGEASFHQVHGGTTNNQPSPEERFGRIASYREHYEELRGRPFSGPRKIVHYVGNIRPNSRRSLARRMAAKHFFRRGRPGDPEGPPSTPIAIPDDLVAEYTEAYWASGAHHETNWMGTEVPSTPDDLFAYQQLVDRTRPAWIIVDDAEGPGRARFLGDLCNLLGHGQVLCLDRTADGMPEVDHPRVTTVRASELDDETLDRVASLVPDRSAMVVIASGGYRDAVTERFDRLARFVAVDAHAVVEWTALNGEPVWPSYGPGPSAAVRLIRKDHPDFIDDPTAETPGTSFHRGGFLRRIR
jgi:cephalosporin hydroxylase